MWKQIKTVSTGYSPVNFCIMHLYNALSITKNELDTKLSEYVCYKVVFGKTNYL